MSAFTRRQFGRSRHRVIFFFCGWQAPYWIYLPLFWVMVGLGYRAYVYNLNEENVADGDAESYVHQLEKLRADVSSLIDAQPTAAHYAFGNSWGAEVALYCAKHEPRIRALFLNTFRGDIPSFVWHEALAAPYKPNYIRRGYTQSSLAKVLAPVDPRADLAKLGDRPILCVYSTTDTVIPPANSRELLQAFDKAGVNYQLITDTRLNHFWVATKYHAMVWRWHKFLRAS